MATVFVTLLPQDSLHYDNVIPLTHSTHRQTRESLVILNINDSIATATVHFQFQFPLLFHSHANHHMNAIVKQQTLAITHIKGARPAAFNPKGINPTLKQCILVCVCETVAVATKYNNSNGDEDEKGMKPHVTLSKSKEYKTACVCCSQSYYGIL